ncbi:Transcriptional regulatory protein RcsB [Achromobacter deleyi]|uniref:Transcriptional regulatory protein RcsB n=1 Tax=Achromobacter deleyi TaxID=1353891 RepID=A0A6S6ZXC4_9BURK|nr:response regulator transcription factor [Achromobacter deleyi]CAB3699227.1 Transcriptional regulatory protein RcsB [Achromobacter deleyi]CAB3851870.1 Transcriptional regulatory protein RcsB [Achromobacter deleyi]CAB3874662.1 Transcriptional regulatory protein RcsB [Achromobacter deleyi]
MKYEFVIADDHPIILAGVGLVIRQLPGCQLVAQASNGKELMDVLARHTCDVLIADYSMPNSSYPDGLALLAFVRRRYPKIRVIIFTMVDNPLLIHRMFELEVSGLLSKMDSFEHIENALHALDGNEPYCSPIIRKILQSYKSSRLDPHPIERLSPRELEVLRLCASGLPVGKVAEQLRRSIKTISTQKTTAMKKLGFANDADLYSAIFEHKLLKNIAI